MTDEFLFQNSVSFDLSSCLSTGPEHKPLTCVSVAVGGFDEGQRSRREVWERLSADHVVALLNEGCAGLGTVFAEEVGHLFGLLDHGCDAVFFGAHFCDVYGPHPRRTFVHVAAYERGRTILWYNSHTTEQSEIRHDRLQILAAARSAIRSQMGLPPLKEI